MKLVISLATRGRPELLCDTIRKSVANWTNKETVMQVQLDHDDPAPYDYLVQQKIHERVLINVQQREDTIAAKWNRAMTLPADVYTVAADDDPYVTPGYDDKILEAAKRFPDGIGFVYANMANLSFTGSLSMTRKLVELLGYIQPDYFPYWFCDHWTDDIGKMIGRIAYGGHRTDQSRAAPTQEMREPAWWATFFDACYRVRHSEAMKVLVALSDDDWRKNMLAANFSMIDQRSIILNDHVRSMPSTSMNMKDPRYIRLKKRAMDMLPAIFADPGYDPALANAFQRILTPPTSIPALKQAFA
jgi:hypothetical protein